MNRSGTHGLHRHDLDRRGLHRIEAKLLIKINALSELTAGRSTMVPTTSLFMLGLRQGEPTTLEDRLALRCSSIRAIP
ncbi:unnamed protein product [Nezara viridula]|uniref:Uncharacterized protein n=1 Tax=Nezara viridula TaxID=85310 RepID=A0A9P0HCB9_NEZVI|nr:unnamed protein product [Nezara viridula]